MNPTGPEGNRLAGPDPGGGHLLYSPVELDDAPHLLLRRHAPLPLEDELLDLWRRVACHRLHASNVTKAAPRGSTA